jgi:hypothetical protein
VTKVTREVEIFGVLILSLFWPNPLSLVMLATAIRDVTQRVSCRSVEVLEVLVAPVATPTLPARAAN